MDRPTYFEFARVSGVSEVIGEVVAGALAAHFLRVFTCFWSLGGYRAVSREPWQRTFLKFSRVSGVLEAIEQVIAEALAARFPRVFTCFWSLEAIGQVVAGALAAHFP